jgi:hypothetical protein
MRELVESDVGGIALLGGACASAPWLALPVTRGPEPAGTLIDRVVVTPS